MRIGKQSLLDMYFDDKVVEKIYLGKSRVYGVVNITFRLYEGAETYAEKQTHRNGMLPEYPEDAPNKTGYIFAGWSTDATITNLISLKTCFVKNTTVYPVYLYYDPNDGEEIIHYTDYLDEASYVFYHPLEQDHTAIMQECYSEEDFFQHFVRNTGKFYIELFAFEKENGDFSGTANGRYHFCDMRGEPTLVYDKNGEDLDGDGFPDTVLPIREEYCHSTDIAAESFSGGTWADFVRAINEESEGYNFSVIVDCLDNDKPYKLQVIDDGNGKEVVALCGEDGKRLVVGGRRDGMFIAVPHDEIIFHGTAYEVLPIEQYYWFRENTGTAISKARNTNEGADL